MARLPEGIRRMCVVAGFALVIMWLFLIGKTPLQWMDMPVDHLAYTAAGSVAAYLVPFIVFRVFFWIKDGFNKSAI